MCIHEEPARVEDEPPLRACLSEPLGEPEALALDVLDGEFRLREPGAGLLAVALDRTDLVAARDQLLDLRIDTGIRRRRRQRPAVHRQQATLELVDAAFECV